MRYLQADADVWLEPTNTQDATHNLLFADSVDGHEKIRTDTGLTYNPNTQVLTTTTFTGALQGNAATATSATSASTATTATTATNVVTVGNNSTNEDNPIVFVADASTGNQSSIGLETDSSFLFNPSTNAVTATTFIGALQGNATSANSASTATSAGSATTATTATNIVLTANTSTSENNAVLFAADAASSSSSIGVEADHAELFYNPGDELLTAKRLQLTSSDSTNVAMLIPNDGYIGSVGDPDAIKIASDGTVTIPHLHVAGDTTTINTTHMTVEDHLIELNHGQTGSPSEDAGFIFERGDSTNVAMVWSEQADRFHFAETDSTGTTTGYINLTADADVYAKSFATSGWKIPQTSPTTSLGEYQYLRVPQNFSTGGTLEWSTVAVGLNELTEVKYNITDFSHSLKIGDTTTGSLSSASNNFIVGQGAANGITSGDENIIIGHDAANNLSTSSSNIILGHEAAKYIGSNGNPGINGNILIGVKSGENLNVGNAANNIAIGEYALSNRTSSATTNNVAVGTNAGKGTSTASSIDSIFIGNNAAATMTNSGSTLIAIGAEAGMVLQGNTGASSNILIGYQAGRDATFSSNTTKNIIIGDNAGRNFYGTTGNIIVGEKAFSQVQDASHTHNIAIGYESLYNSDTNPRSQNVSIGYQAGKGGTGSSDEYGVYIGSQAGESITTGDYNTLIGYYAGQAISSGYDNVLIGKNAGNGIASGHNNIIIGEYAGTSNMNGEIHLYADGNKRISVDSSGAVQFNNAYTFPTSDGTANQVLQTNGTGTLSFATSTAVVTALNNQTADRLVTIGSTTTELDGEANLTFNGSTLTVTGNANIGGNGSTGGVTVQDGAVQIRTSSGNVGYIDFYCESSNAHKVTVKAPPHADYSGDVTFQLPSSNGTNGQVLQTNGSGLTSWTNAAGGASSLNDLSDVVFDTTDFSNSLMLGETPTGTLSGADYNTFVGFLTGRPVTSGTYNAALGKGCLLNLSSGDNNVAMGQEALSNVSTNDENTAIGKHSMRATNGTYNTGLGADSGYRHSGDGATYIGHSAGLQMYTGDYNTYVGYKAGYGGALWTATGDYNIALGVEALEGVTSGTGNIAIGYQAGDNITSANNNTIIGYDLDPDSATAGGEVVIGTNTRRIHIDSSGGVQFNSAFRFPTADGTSNQVLQTNGSGAVSWATVSGGGGGASAINDLSDGKKGGTDFTNSMMMGSITTGTLSSASDNLFISETGAGTALTSGTNNVGIGNNALNALTGGDYNTAVGRYAAASLTTKDNSTAVGYAALQYTAGNWNTAIGFEAMKGQSGLSGSVNYNTALGYQALLSAKTTAFSVALGYKAFEDKTSGGYEVAIGGFAGGDGTTGGNNVLIGYEAGRRGNAEKNTYVGGGAGKGTTSNDNSTNTAIGYQALRDVTTGTGNVILGHLSGTGITSGNNNTIIGNTLNPLSATAGGELVIGTDTKRIHCDSSGGIQFNDSYRFPTGDGTANQVLQTDGGGQLSFATVSSGSLTIEDEGSALSTAATTLDFVGAGVVASGTGTTKTITIAGGSGSLTVQDEGSDLSTAATTLNFVGAGVTASGTGSTKTITIAGGGGGGGITTGKAIAMAMVFG